MSLPTSGFPANCNFGEKKALTRALLNSLDAPPRRVAVASKIALILSATALLGGCATFSGDGGMAAVQASALVELSKGAPKINDEAAAAEAKGRVDTLLKRGVSADAAVQIALLNNRGLQASFNELGVAEAQMVAASLPPNPRFSFSRAVGSGELEIERQIVASIFALATLPARAEIAQDKFRAAQMRTSEAVFRLAADTRRQYYRAVSASEQVAFLQQAKGATEVIAELFKRLGESGGVNKLNQAREYAFYAELGTQLAQAKLQQRIERERLIRLLGLWGRDAALKLPSGIPALPQLRTVRQIEREALNRRVDLRAARADLDVLAKSLGLTQATRFVNDIDLAGLNTLDRANKVNAATGEVERDVARRRGFAVDFEIPIFDFGETKVVQAEETYMQAANKLAEKAVNIRSEAREAYQSYRGNYDIARSYQTQVLPLRKIIQDESVLQYSGMLIDVTDLLADARARILSNVAAINARRDFWIADTDFKHALIGGGISGGGATVTAAAGGGESAPAH